jgi:thiol:disulfide interchange protein
MIKSIKVLFVVLASVLMMSSSSQDSGILFSEISLYEAKVLSKKTGKPIFIDCYTDWCGPCKRMAATSFIDDKVGEVFNNKFINIKIEMEKNPIGTELAKRYRVRAYPTLLIIDSEGALIKQVIGMQNANGLITMANSIP